MDACPKLVDLEDIRTNNWYALGLKLGIEDNDLEAIERQHRGDIDECRRAMFRLWLNTTSHPSRKQLLNALREKTVAETKIADEYERSFQLYEKSNVVALHDIPHPQVDISSSLPSKEKPKLPEVQYTISEYYESQFQAKRGELHILIATVKQIIEDKAICLKSLKFFLNLHPELRKEAKAAESLEDVMTIVCDYTSLINTSYLQAIARNFKLHDAIDLIKKFDDSIDEFCKTIPTEHAYGQEFMEHSKLNLLKSDEVKFVLEWDGDKTTLRDIQSLLRKAFHDKARHVIVKVVNIWNSTIVICYAPHHLHEELTMLVKYNEVYLKEEGVLSVSIGELLIFKRETDSKLNPQEHLKNKHFQSTSMEELGAFKTVHVHKSTKEISAIGTLSLEVTERQILHIVSSSDGHSLPNHAMKETDLSRSDIHFGKADKNEFQREELSSVTFQESDPLLDALKSISILEVAHFLSIYDLRVTEQQQLKLLSLVFKTDTKDYGFPIEGSSLKLLVSVINDTNSKVQKAVYAKEVELTNEMKELAETYEKRSQGMAWDLDARELQNKKFQSMKMETHTKLCEFVGDKVFQSFPEFEEHKEEDSESLEILQKKLETYKNIINSKNCEINELKSELQKKRNELLVSTITSEQGEFNIQSEFKVPETMLQSTYDLTEEEQDKLDENLFVANDKQKIEALIKKGANPNRKQGDYQQTPLHLSSESGHVDIVNLLIAHGADIHIKNWLQQTPLHLSSMCGHVDIVNVLLSHGADIHVKGMIQQTPLHLSSNGGHVDVVNLLLSHGAEIHVKDKRQQTPLHLSSENGHLDIVNVLISHGGDVHVKDYMQRTPLHLSSENGHTEIVNVLLSHGADNNVKDEFGRSPLDWAHLHHTEL